VETGKNGVGRATTAAAATAVAAAGGACKRRQEWLPLQATVNKEI